MSDAWGYLAQVITILLMIAGVGVPAFLFIFKADPNPTEAILLFVLCEIVAGVFGFITKVWQKVENTFIQRNIALNLLLLQRRLEGSYPAFEGIRIVKERKPG